MYADSSFSVMQLITLILVTFGDKSDILESPSAITFFCLVGSECLCHTAAVWEAAFGLWHLCLIFVYCKCLSKVHISHYVCIDLAFDCKKYCKQLMLNVCLSIFVLFLSEYLICTSLAILPVATLHLVLVLKYHIVWCVLILHQSMLKLVVYWQNHIPSNALWCSESHFHTVFFL